MEINKTMWQKAESGGITWKDFYDDKARKKGYKDWDELFDKLKDKSIFMKSGKLICKFDI